MSQQNLRLLALDYGDARIGVAGSDDLGILAHPLETVPAQPRLEALRRIAALFQIRRAEAVVLGLPIRSDGEEGSAATKVRTFAESLMPHLPKGTPLYFQDEFFSTKRAADQLRAAGKRVKHHRPIIDQAAAVVILQEYLDTMNARLPQNGDEMPDLR